MSFSCAVNRPAECEYPGQHASMLAAAGCCCTQGVANWVCRESRQRDMSTVGKKGWRLHSLQRFCMAQPRIRATLHCCPRRMQSNTAGEQCDTAASAQQVRQRLCSVLQQRQGDTHSRVASTLATDILSAVFVSQAGADCCLYTVTIHSMTSTSFFGVRVL